MPNQNHHTAKHRQVPLCLGHHHSGQAHPLQTFRIKATWFSGIALISGITAFLCLMFVWSNCCVHLMQLHFVSFQMDTVDRKLQYKHLSTEIFGYPEISCSQFRSCSHSSIATEDPRNGFQPDGFCTFFFAGEPLSSALHGSIIH